MRAVVPRQHLVARFLVLRPAAAGSDVSITIRMQTPGTGMDRDWTGADRDGDGYLRTRSVRATWWRPQQSRAEEAYQSRARESSENRTGRAMREAAVVRRFHASPSIHILCRIPPASTSKRDGTVVSFSYAAGDDLLLFL